MVHSGALYPLPLCYQTQTKLLWSPKLRTLNPFFERQSGMKVLAIPSMFNALFVRNFVTILNSGELNSSSRQQPEPSFSDKVSRFQLEVRSSMVVRKNTNPQTDIK